MSFHQHDVSKLVLFLCLVPFTLLHCAAPPAASKEARSSESQSTEDAGSTKEAVLESSSQEQPDQTQPAPDATRDTTPPQPDKTVEKPTKTTFGGTRPAKLKVPSSYDHSKPYPLLIVLHGYGASGEIQSAFLGLNRLVEDKGILLIAPDGTQEALGQKKRFWNATDACCNFYQSQVDDVAYVTGLVDEIGKTYNVDPKRVYLLGHSNGGFMSYRLACQASQTFAAIVSLAGATFKNKDLCKPQNAVSILQIHGTNDGTIAYAGGNFQNILFYPGAEESVTSWAGYNGCKGKLEDLTPPYDLDKNVKGDETKRAGFSQCPAGIGVELWTIQSGGHIPIVTPDFAEKTWAWLQQHPKP